MAKRLATVAAFYDGDGTAEGSTLHEDWRDASRAVHRSVLTAPDWAVVTDETDTWSQAVADEVGQALASAPPGTPVLRYVADFTGDETAVDGDGNPLWGAGYSGVIDDATSQNAAAGVICAQSTV